MNNNQKIIAYSFSRSASIARQLKSKVTIFKLERLCRLLDLPVPTDWTGEISDYLIEAECRGVLLRGMGWHSVDCPKVLFIRNKPYKNVTSRCEFFTHCKYHTVEEEVPDSEEENIDAIITSHADACTAVRSAILCWFRHVCFVFGIEFPLKKSKFGYHLKTCEWSDDFAKCGPDTCSCYLSAEKYFVRQICSGVRLKNGGWHHTNCNLIQAIVGKNELTPEHFDPFLCKQNELCMSEKNYFE
jgi:hypothetical protein